MRVARRAAVPIALSLPLAAAAIGTCATFGACTTFAFPAPGESSGPDASVGMSMDAAIDVPVVEASAEAGADGGPLSFLAPESAASLCSLLFRCPGLAEAIELSVVVPLATPPTPNFSACMDWLAGPVDPKRVALDAQRYILAEIAAQKTCAAAAAASPVHPFSIKGGTKCGASCSGSTADACYGDAGDVGYSFTCGAPLYSDDGGCSLIAFDPVCITTGACSPAGVFCRDGRTLVDCTKRSFTSFDCNLSGRTCLDEGAAACVFGGSLAPPCEDPHTLEDTCYGKAVKHCAGTLLAQTEFDCNAVGRTCSTGTGVARCWSPTDTCTPFDTAGGINTCSGGDGGGAASDITICVAGARQNFDCSSIGMQCIGATGALGAHCGPVVDAGP